MKGSILFSKDINIEVDVDPSAAEGARLISAKNLVDGQEAGGGGDLAIANVTVVYAEGLAEIGAGWAVVNEDEDSPYNEMIGTLFAMPAGTYKCPITAAGQVIEVDYNMELVTIVGSAEKTDFGLVITGDCTITFNAE